MKTEWFGHVTCYDNLSKKIPQGTLEGEWHYGRQRKCCMDNIKEWTSLPMPKLITRACCRKDWKRISAESSLMSPRWPIQSRDWTKLNQTVFATVRFKVARSPYISRSQYGSWFWLHRLIQWCLEIFLYFCNSQSYSVATSVLLSSSVPFFFFPPPPPFFFKAVEVKKTCQMVILPKNIYKYKTYLYSTEVFVSDFTYILLLTDSRLQIFWRRMKQNGQKMKSAHFASYQMLWRQQRKMQRDRERTNKRAQCY